MVYSDQYQFIFIAIPKTASTSIEDVLKNYGIQLGPGPAAKHKKARVVREMLGEKTFSGALVGQWGREIHDRRMSKWHMSTRSYRVSLRLYRGRYSIAKWDGMISNRR